MALRRFIGVLEDQKIDKGILIYKTNMTPSANKVRPPFPACRQRATPHEMCATAPARNPADRGHIVLQVIQAMSNQYDLGSFAESDLLVNITQHTLVPKHDVLSPEDKALLLQK